MLNWQEDADISPGRVERPDKGDDHQRPELVEHREGDAGRRHQTGRPDQHGASFQTIGEEPYRQGQQGRPDQRCGGDGTDGK